MQQIPRDKVFPPWVTVGVIDRKYDAAAAKRMAPLSRSARHTLVQTNASAMIKHIADIVRGSSYVSPESGQQEVVWDGIDALLMQEATRFRNLIKPPNLSAKELSFAIVQHLVQEHILVPVFTPTYQNDRWQDGSTNLYMTVHPDELDVWESSRRLQLNV